MADIRTTLVLLLWLPIAAFAQFSYEGHLSSPRITLTQEVTLKLSLIFPPDYHVNVPVMRAHLMQFGTLGVSPFRLTREKIGSPQKASDGLLHQDLSFTLEPQVPGDYHLTFLTIPFEPNTESKGNLFELLSEIYPIHVSAPSEKLDYPIEKLAAPLMKMDPQPPIEISSANRLALQDPSLIKFEEQRNLLKQQERRIPWVAAIALLCAIALLIAPRKKGEPGPKEAAIDPQTAALARLEAIQQGRPDASQLYIELTSTVREYLERVYQMKAKTQTTEEFLREMAKHPRFDEETRKALVAFMQMADEVKFGQYQPSDAERNAAIAAAKRLFK